MKTKDNTIASHLYDLEEKALTWHTVMSSSFLNEEEQAELLKSFPPSDLIIYDGGYEGAKKKKIYFLHDSEAEYDDIECIRARIDQRFRKISHRDVLGALMHLQIDRHSFGDFWVEEDAIYLYTSGSMTDFLITSLTKINQLNVRFERIQDHPVQHFQTKQIHAVVASERMDAIVSGLAHCSRAKAKEMIRQGLVQVNHVTLEAPDKMCDNNVTISVRGVGRFVYKGIQHTTKSDRIVAEFEQSI